MSSIDGTFFEKFIQDSFDSLGTNVSSLVFSDILIVVFWTTTLSLIIALTYRGTHKGISYSQNFTQTLVLLGLIVGTIMIIVGSDIARAFTLVGALSIVRFRNAIKDTRDVGFIFFTMAIGMACGTRFYSVAIFVTLFGCGLMYLMSFLEFGKKELVQDILEMNLPISQEYAQILSPILIKYLKYYSLLGIDSIDDKTNRISFIVTFKKKTKGFNVISQIMNKNKYSASDLNSKNLLLKELNENEYVSDIKIIEGNNSTEI
ncbi:hypothetical protein NEF87_004289 [Candidatus Lokiarchaeum ossiferum]|uniref:DUF4956 domain-containing protein n=1 Tax=Candidatus Lokiarchaeum ossiferum TaxID=2951803 RepID=A0ABY6HZK7_9ARCH|nr:hypothetical protein NEF87_004289 [Candidatus Lokiarchaeum sp. B-35]